MPELTLQDRIKNMLDELPEPVKGEQRREHTLSKTDARWLANMMLLIIENGGCNRGLSEEQAQALKEMSPATLRSIKDIVKERRKVLALVGVGVVTVLVFVGKKVIDMMDYSFWKSIFARMAG